MYRLYLGPDRHTHLEPLAVADLPFEHGPGPLKGVGGTVLGPAAWVSLMRFSPGARSDLHRVNGGLAVLLEGALVVTVSDGTAVRLHPGDAVRIEEVGSGRGEGGWAPANPGAEAAVLALVQMPRPPAPVEPPAHAAEQAGDR